MIVQNTLDQRRNLMEVTDYFCILSTEVLQISLRRPGDMMVDHMDQRRIFTEVMDTSKYKV